MCGDNAGFPGNNCTLYFRSIVMDLYEGDSLLILTEFD